MTMIRELGARLRNIFQMGEMTRRYEDGRIQVQTRNGRVAEKAESFPYGFVARAKNGRTMVLCQGGDVDSLEILPLLPGYDVTPPDLNDGDVALYTGNGARIVLEEAGGIRIDATGPGDITVVGAGGKFYLGNDLTNMCEVMIGIIDEIKGLVTTGAPTSHTVLPASQLRLEAYKNTIRNLLKEGA